MQLGAQRSCQRPHRGVDVVIHRLVEGARIHLAGVEIQAVLHLGILVIQRDADRIALVDPDGGAGRRTAKGPDLPAVAGGDLHLYPLGLQPHIHDLALFGLGRRFGVEGDGGQEPDTTGQTHTIDLPLQEYRLERRLVV